MATCGETIEEFRFRKRAKSKTNANRIDRRTKFCGETKNDAKGRKTPTDLLLDDRLVFDRFEKNHFVRPDRHVSILINFQGDGLTVENALVDQTIFAQNELFGGEKDVFHGRGLCSGFVRRRVVATTRTRKPNHQTNQREKSDEQNREELPRKSRLFQIDSHRRRSGGGEAPRQRAIARRTAAAEHLRIQFVQVQQTFVRSRTKFIAMHDAQLLDENLAGRVVENAQTSVTIVSDANERTIVLAMPNVTMDLSSRLT